MKLIRSSTLWICSAALLSAEIPSDTAANDDLFTGGKQIDYSEQLAEFKAAQEAEANRRLKNDIIPGFESLVLHPDIQFLDMSGRPLLMFEKGDTARRLRGLTDELKAGMLASEETETEDWIQIHADVFSKKKLKVFLLFPELPAKTILPYYGIRIYDTDGDISELMFPNQDTTPNWVTLIRELRAAINKKPNKAEMATPRKPSDQF